MTVMLIIGGRSEGKLAYALKKTGLCEEQAARSFSEAASRPIFYGLEAAVREEMNRGGDPFFRMRELMKMNPSLLVIANEVGCGVVPMDAFEREWRDTVGRILCEIAENSERVVRIVCGLPQVIKGETWN